MRARQDLVATFRACLSALRNASKNIQESDWLEDDIFEYFEDEESPEQPGKILYFPVDAIFEGTGNRSTNVRYRLARRWS